MHLVLIALLLLPLSTFAEDSEYTLVISNHRFEPNELAIPIGQKIKLRIENHDSSAEEFDSYALNREKIIAGNGKATLFIGPLDAGSYTFIGEYHADTAKGVIIAK